MKKKLSLFGKIKDRAKRVKGLFRKQKKDGADHCGLSSENEAPSRDVERMDTVGAWTVDVSRQFG